MAAFEAAHVRRRLSPRVGHARLRAPKQRACVQCVQSDVVQISGRLNTSTAAAQRRSALPQRVVRWLRCAGCSPRHAARSRAATTTARRRSMGSRGLTPSRSSWRSTALVRCPQVRFKISKQGAPARERRACLQAACSHFTPALLLAGFEAVRLSCTGPSTSAKAQLSGSARVEAPPGAGASPSATSRLSRQRRLSSDGTATCRWTDGASIQIPSLLMTRSGSGWQPATAELRLQMQRATFMHAWEDWGQPIAVNLAAHAPPPPPSPHAPPGSADTSTPLTLVWQVSQPRKHAVTVKVRAVAGARPLDCQGLSACAL